MVVIVKKTAFKNQYIYILKQQQQQQLRMKYSFRKAVIEKINIFNQRKKTGWQVSFERKYRSLQEQQVVKNFELPSLTGGLKRTGVMSRGVLREDQTGPPLCDTLGASR